jgi:hypothetical protein
MSPDPALHLKTAGITHHQETQAANDEIDAPPVTAFPSHAHFLEFILMTFGRHLQLGDKSRLIFDSLHIVPESLAKKALYMSLKLLPSLIRCLLIHDHYLPFLMGKRHLSLKVK